VGFTGLNKGIISGGVEVPTDIYRFKLNSIDCLILRDGILRAPDGHTIDLLCLCVKMKEHTVMIDTGYGGGTPDTGALIQNLQRAGISISEIDIVILSHGHPDHIGGIIGSNGQPVFTHARHYIHKKEWEYCTRSPDLSRIDEFMRQLTITAIQKNLLPLQGQVHLIDRESEIVPGIRVIESPGHAPGHISVSITSGPRQLLCLCDAIHEPAEFSQPDLYRQTDLDPDGAERSRAKLLNNILQPGALVFASHFPFPGLGQVVKNGDAWQWQPIQI
jgi:glyoxylase-like metal-dependent hydrolase (beta-lactamase superfamily II)